MGRGGGRYQRENAGISGEGEGRILAVEGLRFPGEGLSPRGKSGTRVGTKVVADEQRVDIPVPPILLMKQ